MECCPPNRCGVCFKLPTIEDFQTRFARDFPFGDDASHVQNSDIEIAMREVRSYINPELFHDQCKFTQGALQLCAHYLVMNLRASSQGIWGQFDWMHTAKTVGSLKQTMEIPRRVLEHPMLGMLTQTNYGTSYLYMVLPELCGMVFASWGGTNY